MKPVIILITLIGSFLAPQPISERKLQPIIQTKPAYSNKVQQEIYIQSLKSEVDLEDAMRIANCESSFDQYARNANSSASGVYQFISKTWDNYCTGDVFNAKDNVQCFFKLYPEHKSWWECK